MTRRASEGDTEKKVPNFRERVRALRATPASSTAIAERQQHPSDVSVNGSSPVKEPKPDKRREIVELMNREFAVLTTGSGVEIIRETTDTRGKYTIVHMDVAAFRLLLQPYKTFLGDGEKPIQNSKLWLDDPRRRAYDGIVFEPDGAPPRFFNMWKGFAVEPNAEASCQRFISHVADNVCRGDPELLAWVMGWFAALVQRPSRKTGTALVLRGAQGAGKTIVGRVMGALLGPHYALVSDPRYVTGRFNSDLENRLLVQLDEATWGGDHETTGKLKDLITGDTQLIERKGREPYRVRNLVRLLFTTNNEWAVPAGMDERRFAVLDVGAERMQDSAYFQAIEDEQDAGGAGALLHYLQTFDLEAVDLKHIPNTAALYEQKLESMSSEQSWWHERLHAGVLPGDRDGTGETTFVKLYASYIEGAQDRGVHRRVGQVKLAKFLDGAVPNLRRQKRSLGATSATRGLWYIFPALAECRVAFERAVRHTPTWYEAENGSEWSADHGP